MQSIEGKVAWVTGAGTGIGRGGALALAKAGATVVVSGRRPEPIQATADAIAAAGGKAVVEQADIADPAGVKALAERVKTEHGSLDMLVNSAGINIPNRRWKDLDAESWRQVVEVNLNGAFYCAAAVLPIMREQRDGLIINISSWAGRQVGIVSGVPYTASKHGLNAMTESLNIENCHYGIRACAICPGEVATEILDKRPMPPSPEDRARMVQEEDMGETILFVARMPKHVCVNEILISPTWNKNYIGGPDRYLARDD